MDVRELSERIPEPASTATLRQLLARVQTALTPWQLAQLARADDVMPHAADTLNAIRRDVGDATQLRGRAVRFAAAGERPQVLPELSCFDDLVEVVAHAAAKPAVASAFVWLLLAAFDEDLASHLIQVIRERARLPRLTSRVTRNDVGLAAATPAALPALVACFADRQVADTCARIEIVPAPLGPADRATLTLQLEALERARRTARRVSAATFSGFARRVATFLVHLSVKQLDPLGFGIERDVQLDADPPLERRLEMCAWARRAGHMIAARGSMFVLAMGVKAPWPLRLELIAAEPGHGLSGCLELLLRLDGGGEAIVTSHAPAMLLLADESDEERGARFERWLAVAYPQAIAAWQAWS